MTSLLRVFATDGFDGGAQAALGGVLGKALGEARQGRKDLGTAIDVVRRLLPDVLELVGVLGGENRDANRGGGNTGGTVSLDEQQRTRCETSDDQPFSPVRHVRPPSEG